MKILCIGVIASFMAVSRLMGQMVMPGTDAIHWYGVLGDEQSAPFVSTYLDFYVAGVAGVPVPVAEKPAPSKAVNSTGKVNWTGGQVLDVVWGETVGMDKGSTLFSGNSTWSGVPKVVARMSMAFYPPATKTVSKVIVVTAAGATSEIDVPARVAEAESVPNKVYSQNFADSHEVRIIGFSDGQDAVLRVPASAGCSVVLQGGVVGVVFQLPPSDSNGSMEWHIDVSGGKAGGAKPAADAKK